VGGWYRTLKPSRSRADRIRTAVRAPINTERTRKPPKTRSPKDVFYKTYSNNMYINGYKAKVITRYGIAKLFNVGLKTIHVWDKCGVLPEPFMLQERGNQVIPIYLASQIRCLMIVVTDLVAQGYVSIRWEGLPEYLEMLHTGYAEVMLNFNKRLNKSDDEDIEFLD
jgi:hypothetical protein